MDVQWTLLIVIVITLMVLAVPGLNKKRYIVARLKREGYQHVFSGGGTNFIALNTHTATFRFGSFGIKKIAERPVSFLSRHEWRCTERKAEKVDNTYLFHLSDADDGVHEVHYYDQTSLAERDWDRFQAAYQKAIFHQYEAVKNMSRLQAYDVFISHASEDKAFFVCPFVQALTDLGLRVWHEAFTRETGDSLRSTLHQGLGKARYGIVVLSPAFFALQWAQDELDALVSRSMPSSKSILPVWHQVQHQDVSRYSHRLADKAAFLTSTSSIEEMAMDFLRLIQKSPH